MAAEHSTAPEPETPAEVLGVMRAGKASVDAGERAMFLAALDWADMHPAESLDAAAGHWVPGGEEAVALAGEGAPLVAEFCVPELAGALALTADAGRSYLGEALEIRHRLPRLYRQVTTGRVPVWRARRIARHTIALPAAGADFVDQQVYWIAGKIGPAALERHLAAAKARFDPEAAEQDRERAFDGRRFDIHLDPTVPTSDGVAEVSGVLDVADALDLAEAVRRGAEELKALGNTESLDVRRSLAVGRLAREQNCLDFVPGPVPNPDHPDDDRSSRPTSASDERVETPGGGQRGGHSRVIQPRQVVLHAHLSAAALTGNAHPDCGCRIATLDDTRSPVTVDQVREWCGDPQTQVVVRPVLDLNAHHESTGYTPSTALRELQQAIDRTCVFPGCTRRATACDCDHIEEWDPDDPDAGGPTCSCNTGSLCRFHHRVKTHTSWRYDVLAPGTYVWTSPHGQQFLRTADGGTLPIEPGKPLRLTPSPDE